MGVSWAAEFSTFALADNLSRFCVIIRRFPRPIDAGRLRARYTKLKNRNAKRKRGAALFVGSLPSRWGGGGRYAVPCGASRSMTWAPAALETSALPRPCANPLRPSTTLIVRAILSSLERWPVERCGLPWRVGGPFHHCLVFLPCHGRIGVDHCGRRVALRVGRNAPTATRDRVRVPTIP